MSEKPPRIRSRKTTRISPWVEIIAREVEFTEGAEPKIYHAVGQQDYIGMLAKTPTGQFLIVRQYRPAVEGYTWELPAGLVDEGEDPEQSCRRELMEETGYPARAIHRLGTASPCTGRFSNRIHSYFVETGERDTAYQTEAGIEIRLLGAAELAELIAAGEFASQLHLGTILLAAMHSFIDLEAEFAIAGGRRR